MTVNPSNSRSNKRRQISGETSRGDNPVPPFVMITSICGSASQRWRATSNGGRIVPQQVANGEVMA